MNFKRISIHLRQSWELPRPKQLIKIVSEYNVSIMLLSGYKFVIY